MEFKNLRPYAVDIPALGRTVAPGEVFEITGDAGTGLLKQTDAFERVDKPEKKEK